MAPNNVGQKGLIEAPGV
jgi:hypothetical protein